MSKSVIVVLITLSIVILGCATGPTDPAAPQPSIVIDDTSIDTPVVLARQVYRNGRHLYIQFQDPQESVNSYAVLPDLHQAPGVASTASQALQQAMKYYNDLPLAHLSYLDPEEWILRTHALESIPVASVALWREFRDRLIAAVTPIKPGKGIAVEFLKQEELFFYYDQMGLLHSVPLADKPADVRIDDTYRFSELLSRSTALLGDYISAVRGTESAELLFNTGDNADFGYPFIYANKDSGQVVFLRGIPANPDCCVPSANVVPDAVVHATISHVDCFLRQPIGSIARLFDLVSFKFVDTITPKPILLLKDQPIPPLADNEPMDPDQWEQELSELAYSPVSQGTIEFLVDGAAFFNRLIDAIHSAEHSIDIRLYIFDNDDYALKIADLLKQRSREVKVRVLVDGLGTLSATWAHSPTMPKEYEPPHYIIDYLKKDSNVKVRTVLNPWLTGDHTKTIIIDRRTAFLGGMNIGREYRYDWHDLMVEIQGPVVDEIQTNFEKAWRLQSFLGDIRAALYRPGQPVNQPGPDDIPIRLLFTKPGDSQILRTQIAAIGRATQRIYIENAYFTSDDVIFELAMARRRGVDVRVIIPYRSDSGIIDRSNVVAINAMLHNGIRVYLYPGASHVKGAVYDGWICLGSANFDQLSLRMNKEFNIATSDPVAVQAFIDQVMTPDFEKSIELKEPLPSRWSDYLLEMIADQL